MFTYMAQFQFCIHNIKTLKQKSNEQFTLIALYSPWSSIMYSQNTAIHNSSSIMHDFIISSQNIDIG